jgi:Integrase zinc binding domain
LISDLLDAPRKAQLYTKIGSEHLLGFNYIIRYHAGRLGTKPDALTRRGDVYPKGGDGAYTLANPHNFQSIFKTGQLIHAIILDSASLLTSIQQGQGTDPLSAAHINCLQSNKQADVPLNGKPDPWSFGEDGKTLLYKQRTYVPDHNDIHLDILHSLHDHQAAGHPGISKTMRSICWQYRWPHMSTFVTDYIGSCLKCRHAKSIHHKPFGPLQFLPIGERLWDSISMDFIEGLPLSDGHDIILVIVHQLTTKIVMIREQLSMIYIFYLHITAMNKIILIISSF